MTYALSLIIAVSIPVAILYLMYTQNLYGTSTFKFVLVCFLWGLASFGLALLINRALLNAEVIDLDTLRRFSAPILEEVLKGLILLVLVRRARFQFFVDGAIYGFAAGIGFAAIENIDYINANASAALDVAIARVISTNLMHATASALVGITAGYARYRHTRPEHFALIAGGILCAMLLHVGFNNLVTRVSSGLLLLYAASVGIGGALGIYFIIRRGLAEARQWIESSAGQMGQLDGVTAFEMASVNKLGQRSFKDVLKPIQDQFDAATAERVEQFLVLQGRLGIYRNRLAEINDAKMKADQLALITQTQDEMNALRRELGSFVMLTVRQLYKPEVLAPLFNRLEDRIEAQAAARPAGGSPGLFDALSARIEQSAALTEASPALEAEQKP